MDEKLTGFSGEVKAQFIGLFPFLLKLEHEIIKDEENTFYISIKAPSPNSKFPLYIDTFADEVTVGFDAYHARFNEFVGESEDENASGFINKIINDDFAVVSYWRDDQWCGSSLLQKGSFPTNNEQYPYANAIKIRSWSGALDSEIICVPRD